MKRTPHMTTFRCAAFDACTLSPKESPT